MLAGLGPPHAIWSSVISVHHSPSSNTLRPPLRHRRPQGIVLCNEGGVTHPCEPAVVVRVRGVVIDVDVHADDLERLLDERQLLQLLLHWALALRRR